MMAVDWKNCLLTDRNLRITTDKAKLSHRFSNWIIGLQLAAIILYSCGVLAVSAGNVQRMNISAREHILKMKLPFKVSTSPVYVLITILQFFHLAICGCGISMVNSLIVTLVSPGDSRGEILMGTTIPLIPGISDTSYWWSDRYLARVVTKGFLLQ